MNDAVSPVDPPPLKFRTKFFYGIGSMAYGVKDVAFRVYLLWFYNYVIGAPAALVSLAILVALVVDALSDPIVGQISDGLRTKWGRQASAHVRLGGAGRPELLPALASARRARGLESLPLPRPPVLAGAQLHHALRDSQLRPRAGTFDQLRRPDRDRLLPVFLRLSRRDRHVRPGAVDLAGSHRSLSDRPAQPGGLSDIRTRRVPADDHDRADLDRRHPPPHQVSAPSAAAGAPRSGGNTGADGADLRQQALPGNPRIWRAEVYGHRTGFGAGALFRDPVLGVQFARARPHGRGPAGGGAARPCVCSADLAKAGQAERGAGPVGRGGRVRCGALRAAAHRPLLRERRSPAAAGAVLHPFGLFGLRHFLGRSWSTP